MCYSFWVYFFPIATHLPNWVLQGSQLLAQILKAFELPSAPSDVSIVNMGIFILKVAVLSLSKSSAPVG